MSLKIFDFIRNLALGSGVMNEMSLCRYLVAKFREYGARVTRIENAVTSGVPDINVQAYGEEKWIEAKMCDHVSGAHISKIRPSQYCWHRDQVRAGGNAFILVFNRRADTVALFESCDVVRTNQGPWVSDKKGAKPKIVCQKKAFMEEFMKKYTAKREPIVNEPAGIHLRSSNRVETSEFDADVAF